MIVGLSGYAGSGKSTAAKALIDLGFERRKFARPLKDMLRALLRAQGEDEDVIEEMIEGCLKGSPSELLNGATPRHAMQTLGTDWGRALICENLWSDAALRNMGAYVVFDDVRFENEAAGIRDVGGIIVRIHRPGVGPVNDHVSEELVVPDYAIFNDETPEHLERQIARLISEAMGTTTVGGSSSARL